LTSKWERYWNQVTPEYAGKWITVEPTKDRMAWAELDYAYNYAKSKEYLFRGHNFVWGK
jgi:endo-1,4-beta-xylanase